MKNFILAVLLMNVLILGCNAQNNAASNPDSIHRVINLRQLTVLGQKHNANNNYEFSTEKSKTIVTLAGENDVLRYLGTLPGVTPGLEGSLGFFVRGSNTGNNRIELDGVPVYGNTHFFGLLSAFHPDIIENVNFFSGSFPATSGDFSSALVQIKTITPDTLARHSKFNISPYFVGYSSNGKLKNNIAYTFASRFSLIGLEFQLLKTLINNEMKLAPYVGDLYLKLNFGPANEKMYVSAYWNNDYYKYNLATSTSIVNCGNGFINFNREKIYHPDLKLETSAYLNTFFSGQTMKMTEDKSEISIKSRIFEFSLQNNLSYTISNCIFDAGINLKHRTYHPASEKVLSGISQMNVFDDSYSNLLFTLYATATYDFKLAKLTAGLRQNLYFDENYRIVPFTDFAINSIFNLTSKTTITLSYDHISQSQHTLEGLPTGWSVDLIVPADSKLPIETTNQLYFGESTNYKFLNFSAGIFLKSMKHLVSYINTLSVFNPQNTSWEEEVTYGSGQSYGFECRIEKTGKRYNGALSYTWSKTNRNFSAINDGLTFPFKYDRENVLNFNNQFLLFKTKKSTNNLHLTLSYSTGHRETVNIGQYSGYPLPYWNIMGTGELNYVMSRYANYRDLMTPINGYILPFYLRVDLGYSKTVKKKNTTRELFLGVYNVLNRRNPYLIANDFGTWKQLSFFPIMPSISWTISFN